MKKIVIVISLLIIGTFFCSQVKDKIAEIRTKCQKINQNIKTFSKKEKEDDDSSEEGGSVIAFYKDHKLQLITAEYFGETGKWKDEYYFDNGNLVFVIKNQFEYNRPIYWDKKMAKENDDTAYFDNKKTTKKTDKFYLDGDKVILWINNKNKEEQNNSAVFIKQESDVKKEGKRLEKLMK